jgi:hypothetical protein
MPNGFGPPPALDVENSASLGNYLAYQTNVLIHIYDKQEDIKEHFDKAVGEVKDEVAALSVWQTARENERQRQIGRDEERGEQRERGEKRLGRWKLRFETVAQLGAALMFGIAVGAAVVRFVLGG